MKPALRQKWTKRPGNISKKNVTQIFNPKKIHNAGEYKLNTNKNLRSLVENTDIIITKKCRRINWVDNLEKKNINII